MRLAALLSGVALALAAAPAALAADEVRAGLVDPGFAPRAGVVPASVNVAPPSDPLRAPQADSVRPESPLACVVDEMGDPCCLPCPRWAFTLGAWIWGLEGTLGADGRRVEADGDWTDTLDNLDKVEFGLDLRARVEWNRWAVTLQVDGATIEDSASFQEGALNVGAEAGFWMVQADVGYKFGPGYVGCGECRPALCVEAYLGARAYFLDLDIDSTGIVAPNGVSSSMSWVDPIVGMRAHLTKGNWRFGLEGDIGGFEVGSDFAWNLMGFVGYRFTSVFGAMIGWRAVDVDYQDGNDIFDARLSGPIVALTFEF